MGVTAGLLQAAMLLSILLMGMGTFVPRFQGRSVWGLVLVFGGALAFTACWLLSSGRP